MLDFMVSIFFAFVSALAAEAGGFLALYKRKNLNLTLGFTAGALIGLVAFDLLPEIFEFASSGTIDIIWPMIALVVGFLLFHTVEKSILIHQSQEKEYTVHRHPHVGYASAAALIGHSFLDGASIGLAFQVNNTAGIAVALAVIGHRFADGFNGVNLMLSHKTSREQSKRVLAVVALAPILGAVFTMFYSFPDAVLATYLGFFAGFMLYIGASDILPQAHSKGASRATVALTILGAVFMFAITRFIEG
jgi:zinc and cadmium transporter